MSSDHATLKPEDDRARVEFTPDEHRQLCEAVAASVSATLGGMPVSATFHPGDALFVVEVVGRIAPGDKN